jgi:pimeloyl-ACP methyl ester carboxylesterase
VGRICWTLLAIAFQCGSVTHAADTLASCELPGVKRPAKCGVVEVPENWDKPAGRKLSLAVAVIPAEVAGSNEDPIVPLMGGPGEAALPAAQYFVERLEPLLRDRDLLLLDQRGTEQSGALRCALFDPKNPAASLRDLYPAARIERCAKELGARTDLTQYTYTHFARDLEHVRSTLGYGQLNLSGGSYGTRAAQFYLRTYPQNVRTVYFGSVVPLDVATPLTLAKTADGVRNQTFDACAADAACRAAFPNLRAQFNDIVKQLESGKPPIARGRAAEWFRSRMYRPEGATELPWMINRAHAGDWSPIAQSIQASVAAIDEEASFGLFFAITCNDDVAFIREADIARESRDTFLGDYRVRQQQAACRWWPKVSPPTNRTPLKSAVPALFVSGDTDPATPLWYTRRVAAGFSERAEVVVAGHGHTEWNDCIARLNEQFVRDGSVRNVRGKTCDAVPRPPFKTDTPVARAACKQGAFASSTGDYVVVVPLPDPTAAGQRYLFRDGRRGSTADASAPLACADNAVTVKTSGGSEERWPQLPFTTTDTKFSSVETELKGRLIEPVGAADGRPLVVMVHGSERTSAMASPYSYSLAAQGISVFVYDKRGTGGSGGDYTQNFELLATDAAAAFAHAKTLTRGRIGRAGYFGGSQGGWIAPLAATRTDAQFVAIGFGLVASPIEEDREEMISEARALGLDSSALALINRLSAATSRLLLSDFSRGYDELGKVRRELAQQPWSQQIHGEYSGEVVRLTDDELRRLGRARFDNLELIWDYDSVAALQRVNVPVLWVLAAEDREAPIETTRAALLKLKKAGKPIDLYLFPNTDHGMMEFVTNPGGSRTVTRITDGYLQLLGDWIKGRVAGPYGRAQKLD